MYADEMPQTRRLRSQLRRGRGLPRLPRLLSVSRTEPFVNSGHLRRRHSGRVPPRPIHGPLAGGGGRG